MVTGWPLNKEDQAVLALHNDPAEYQQRLVKAECKLHSIFAHMAPVINDCAVVLDIGSATGKTATILRDQGHGGLRFANDISKENLDWTMERDLYFRYLHGPADDVCDSLLEDHEVIDWAVLISVTYYLSPERLRHLLETLGTLCQRGIVVTYDGVPQEMADKWTEESGGERVVVYDHREQFSSWVPDDLWKSELYWSGIGWRGSKTLVPVPCDFVVMRRRSWND